MGLRAVVLAIGAVASAHASLIVLTPSSVIGGSGSYSGTYNTGQYRATNILDTQSGSITDGGSGYWLNPDNGPADAYITIDLGASYSLDEVTLFNTHNSGFNDRGTGNFTIKAGNSVVAAGGSAGMKLDGTAVTVVSGTLVAASSASEPIPGQTFSFSGSGPYRYIEFHAASVAVSGGSCCGANNYGLNEMRVYEGVPVPEPGSTALFGAGLAALLVRRRLARSGVRPN